ncbi:MAG TPA: ribosome-associated translation inhibitor RaiA [Candidatus Paceibacterota bacterium]|nr:ribosome-associated translation inhibitor RaiA [Candidatus Paceibacterota bacterium]
MNYNLKGTNLSITSEIREYLERKIGSLDKLLSDTDAARADIELEFLKDEEKMYRAEAMLHDPHTKVPMRAEARGTTLHEAIDMVAGELFSELSRAKKKRVHLLRRGAGHVKDIIRGFRDRF